MFTQHLEASSLDSTPVSSNETVTNESRQERKERTRRAILDAALDQLSHTSFDSISLRQLAKAVGIVPTGFYRHFATLDELGLALVEESFGTLRDLIREVRLDNDLVPDTLIDRSVDRSEEHTSELQSLMRISYAVFCLKNKHHHPPTSPTPHT